MAKKKADLMELPVSFGSVSFGKKTARVGVVIEREHVNLKVADATFCDRRLAVTIVGNGNGDQPGQGRLEGMEDEVELTGVADVKGFGVHSTTIGLGLTFNINELNKTLQRTGVRFSDFAAREGRLLIAQVDDIPDDDGDGDGQDDGQDE